jgi:hypothetical protein
MKPDPEAGGRRLMDVRSVDAVPGLAPVLPTEPALLCARLDVRRTADPAELNEGAEDVLDRASDPLLATTASFARDTGLAPGAFFCPASRCTHVQKLWYRH